MIKTMPRAISNNTGTSHDVRLAAIGSVDEENLPLGGGVVEDERERILLIRAELWPPSESGDGVHFMPDDLGRGVAYKSSGGVRIRGCRDGGGGRRTLGRGSGLSIG